ncbi:hypothetical protein DFP73DRAFT_592155 [Morchella snyderi]|nr:hypothetical protein DFP73DRAFT_592155 [Morchella snyderi]
MVALTRSQARKNAQDEAPVKVFVGPVQSNTGGSKQAERGGNIKPQPNKTVNTTKKIAVSGDGTSHQPPPVIQSLISSLNAPSKEIPTEESDSLSPTLPDAPPNTPDHTYILHQATHTASQITQSFSQVPDVPPNTPQSLCSSSGDVQSSPGVMQSPLEGRTAPQNSPLFRCVTFNRLTGDTHSLSQIPEAPTNTPLSSPVSGLLLGAPLSPAHDGNILNNRACLTVEAQSERLSSALQIIKSAPVNLEGLPISLVISQHGTDSVVKPPNSAPQVIQSPPKEREGSPTSLVASQYVSESEVELPSSPPEVLQSPPKDREGSPTSLVASQYVSESEPELPSSAPEIIQSRPNIKKGSLARPYRPAYISGLSTHASDNDDQVPSSCNRSLGDNQISTKIPQQISEDPTGPFRWHLPDIPVRTQSAPYERFDYSSDTPREPAEPVSSDKILWDASDLPRAPCIVARDLFPERISLGVELGEAAPTLQGPQKHEMLPEDDNDRALSSPSSVVVAEFSIPSAVPLVPVGDVALAVHGLNQLNAAQPDYMDGDLSSDDEDLHDTRLTEFPTSRNAHTDPRIIRDYRALDAAQQAAQALKDEAEAPKQHVAIESPPLPDEAGLFTPYPLEPLVGGIALRVDTPVEPQVSDKALTVAASVEPPISAIALTVNAPLEPPVGVKALTVDVPVEPHIGEIAAEHDYMDCDLSSDDDDLDDIRLTEYPTGHVEPKVIKDYRRSGAVHQAARAAKDAIGAPEQHMATELQGESEVNQTSAFLDANPPSPMPTEWKTTESFKSREATECVESWIAKSLPAEVQHILQYERRDITSDMAATMFRWHKIAVRTPIDEKNPGLMCLRSAPQPSSPIMTSQEHMSNLQIEKHVLIGRSREGGKRKGMAAWIEKMGECFEKHIGEEKGTIEAYYSLVLYEKEDAAIAYFDGEQGDDEKASSHRRLSQYDPDGSPGPRFDFEYVVRQNHLPGTRLDENDRPKEHRLLGTDYSSNHRCKRLRLEVEGWPTNNASRQEQAYQPSLPAPPADPNLRVWPHNPAHHSCPESPDERPDFNDNDPDPQQKLTHKGRSDGDGNEHYGDEHEY